MNDIKNCIVGVHVDGVLRGAGYVVSESIVVTCAHVITDNENPPNNVVSVRFHCSGDEQDVEVNPKWWSDETKDDIAGLKLTLPIPDVVEFARLGRSAGRKNQVCEVFGYPDLGDLDGLGGRATIIEEVGDDQRKLIQLESKSATCGYSGSPLLDPETGEVIGTIVEIADIVKQRYAPHLHGRLDELAFATPIEVVADLIKELPLDSLNDVETHEKTKSRVREGIKKILKNQQSAKEYLARSADVDKKDPIPAIVEYVLGTSLAKFLPLMIRGFADHADSDRDTAIVFRDLASYVLPQIYNDDLLRDIRRQLNSGSNFLVIPASHKSIIELVVTGVLGGKLSFKDAWEFEGDMPSGKLEITPVGEPGILHGENLDKFRVSFEKGIMKKIGGLAKHMPDQTKAINRKLKRLKNGDPPIRYYFVYPEGVERVDELETRYPDIVFISHEVTDHNDDDFDILDGLIQMFCPESQP